MKKLAVTLILAMTALSAAAQQPPTPDAQIAAMKKLDYMAGKWVGEGWMQMGPQRSTFRGSETIQRKLDGTALLVEGAFFGKKPGSDVEVPVHTTLAVISYDPKGQKYDFATWLATGTSGDHVLTLTDKGWWWDLTTPGGKVKYTMTLTEAGEWLEIGEWSSDGAQWRKFFEMKLKKE
ncbi:MAG TPA: hypothetical protein VNA69_04290 [Thermoanaerobaculia bacterium]|nr:hypothetical protein [Thermoanaerobaculia bacterium]